MRILLLSAVTMCILMGCRAEPVDQLPINADNPLDIAASEANLIVDPNTVPPVGLYQRSHVAGTDGLCVADAGSDNLRFGIVMHFGPTLVCEGSGTAQHDGTTLTLAFTGADCKIDADYDGQSVRIPGVVPAGCAALCGERASMSGGAMLRVGWADADATRLRSRRDVLNARAPRQLCINNPTP